jgi:hypothetical protein
MLKPPEPPLAPPGAGLPPLELFFGRLFFRLGCWTGRRGSFDRRIAVERAAIRTLVTGLTAEQAGRRVLIPRIQGLEDSSRYWSVWMVLEHLRIVHTGLAPVIVMLGQNIRPPGQASTARVKPSAEVSEAVMAEYESATDAVVAAIAAVPNLHTRERFTHPWFGSLDAHGWHALIGAHLGIHRRQIERIIAGLSPEASRQNG